MKFCKNCQHFRASLHPDPKMDYAKCARTVVIEPHPVSGAMQSKMSFCETQRAMYGECGVDAKFYEESRAEEVA